MAPLDRRAKWPDGAAQAIRAAREFVGKATLADYLSSLMQRCAVERQLDIPREAGARPLREEAPPVEHMPAPRRTVGLRNRVIHGYAACDDALWHTARADLPALPQQLEGPLSAWPRAS